MRNLFFVTACLTTCFAPVLAHADIRADLRKLDKQYSACSDNAISNVDMKNCAYDFGGKADDLLNKSYKKIIATLSKKSGDEMTDSDNAEQLKRLKEAQRAWITYRDTYCNLQGIQMLGGTGEGLVYGGCIYDQTAKQTKMLEDLFNPEN